MKNLLYIVLLVIVLYINLSEAKKGKKKEKIPERPRNIDPALYCESCKAITKEMLKKIRGSRSEIDIYDALSDICNQKNYYVYEFPPPDMVNGCNAFIPLHDETLAEALRKRTNDEDVVTQLCDEITQACKDVGPKEKPSKFDVEINGVKSSYSVETGAPISNDEL